MRKWFCNVLESFDERLSVGGTLIYNKPTPNCSVGFVANLEIMNIESGDTNVLGVTKGMGFADFKDEEDYKNRLHEVVEQKMKRAEIPLQCSEEASK